MLVSILISCLLVIACVLTHYEGLTHIAKRLISYKTLVTYHLIAAILIVLCLHLLEISIFSFGIFIAHHVLHLGDFKGDREFQLIDYFHFSAETFVTVGYGDLYPMGPLRIISSLESLTGVLLISWSGAFTYFTVQKMWEGQPWRNTHKKE